MWLAHDDHDAALQVFSAMLQRPRCVARGRVVQAPADRADEIERERRQGPEDDVQRRVGIEPQPRIDGAEDVAAAREQIACVEPESHVLRALRLGRESVDARIHQMRPGPFVEAAPQAVFGCENRLDQLVLAERCRPVDAVGRRGVEDDPVVDGAGAHRGAG